MDDNLNNWIEDKSSLIVSKQDRILFDEVAGCLKNRHYRAAFIMAWISIAESLKRKIQEFSNLGNTEAEEAAKKIEEGEKQKNSVDKLIFELASKCGIIDEGDTSSVKYLWEQRCLFAHPYEKQPTIDAVKFIIDQSIKITLGKSLNFNKDYLTQVCEDIVEKPYFLQNDIPVIRDFVKRILARTPKKLYPFLFKTLLYKLGQVTTKDFNKNELTKLRFFIIEILLNTTIPLTDSTWGLETRAVNYPYESFIGYVHSETWVKIPERIKDILFAFFESEKDPKKTPLLKRTFANMIEKSKLQEPHLSRFTNKLDRASFNSSISYYGSNEATFNRIKSEMITHSYNSQGDVIDYLKGDNAISRVTQLDIEQQVYIGRLLISASGNNHYKSKSLVSSIQSKYYKYSDFVRAGIAIGSIISLDNDFRTTITNIYSSVKNLNSLDTQARNFVYDLTLPLFKTKEIKFYDTFFSEDELTKITERVNETITWADNHQEQFNALIEGFRYLSSQKKGDF